MMNQGEDTYLMFYLSNLRCLILCQKS